MTGIRDSLLTGDSWERAQREFAVGQRMQELQKKTEHTEQEFKSFMNDRGEMRRLPGVIIATKMVRNPQLELRMLEMNRDQYVQYVILVGAVLSLFVFL
jgi:hypothetical protein